MCVRFGKKNFREIRRLKFLNMKCTTAIAKKNYTQNAFLR